MEERGAKFLKTFKGTKLLELDFCLNQNYQYVFLKKEKLIANKKRNHNT